MENVTTWNANCKKAREKWIFIDARINDQLSDVSADGSQQLASAKY